MSNADRQREQNGACLGCERTALHVRLDAAHSDKFDGKVSEELWQRIQADWERDERRIEAAAIVWFAKKEDPLRTNNVS